MRQQKLTRDQLLIKLGAARKEAGPAAWQIIYIQLPDRDQAVTPETFGFKLNWQKLREARRREGSYLLRSNVTGGDPAQLWAFYLQLVEVEQAFKELKGDLAIRPIYHQTDERIEAHVSRRRSSDRPESGPMRRRSRLRNGLCAVYARIFSPPPTSPEVR